GGTPGPARWSRRHRTTTSRICLRAPLAMASLIAGSSLATEPPFPMGPRTKSNPASVCDYLRDGKAQRIDRALTVSEGASFRPPEAATRIPEPKDGVGIHLTHDGRSPRSSIPG